MVSSKAHVGQKITDKIEDLPQDAPYYSFEFFPPKTQAVTYIDHPLIHAKIARVWIIFMIELLAWLVLSPYL